MLPPVMSERLKEIEGGYVNDPADPGGETNWGITWPFLNAARAAGAVTQSASIKTLTWEQADACYDALLWTPAKLGQAHPAIGWQVMDFAVNSGLGQAIRSLQRAIGVASDGHFGPVSQAAMEKQSSTDTLALLLAERLEFMTGLKNWAAAGKGWARRIAKNLRYVAADT